MRILFFTKGDKSVPSSRFRVWYVAEYLKRGYGWDYNIIHSIAYPFWLPSTRRFRVLKNAYKRLSSKEYDLIFVHKSLFPLDIVLLIIFAKLRWGKKLIYDLDDAEWMHSKIKSVLLAYFADAVFCGSHLILDWAKKYNKHAYYIPTCVDYKLYRQFRIEPKEKPVYTLTWEGIGRSHWKTGDVQILKPVFEILKQKNFSFRFVLIGSQNFKALKDYFSNDGYPVVFVDELNWSNDPVAVPRALKQCQTDIGLAPLSDVPFEKGKCAFKAIEYMACGIPVIASPIGENSFVVQEGMNGFLARHPYEWAEKIIRFFSDFELRRKMCYNALDTVKEKYSYQSIIPRIKTLTESI